MARLPWIDALGGLFAGLLVALLLQVVAFIAAANVAYSSLGFTLALLPRERLTARRRLLTLLILANLGWTVVCGTLAFRFAPTASLFGMLHLVGEGLYVATLAALEWRYRRVILGPA